LTVQHSTTSLGMLSIILQAKSKIGGHPKRLKSITNITKNASDKIKNSQNKQNKGILSIQREKSRTGRQRAHTMMEQ
jgi:hypothetical protein